MNCESRQLEKDSIPVGEVTVRDEKFDEAARIVVESQKASIGLIQRQLKIGFVRAYNIMEQLCAYGIVGEQKEGAPRDILICMDQLENMLFDINDGNIETKD